MWDGFTAPVSNIPDHHRYTTAHSALQRCLYETQHHGESQSSDWSTERTGWRNMNYRWYTGNSKHEETWRHEENQESKTERNQTEHNWTRAYTGTTKICNKVPLVPPFHVAWWTHTSNICGFYRKLVLEKCPKELDATQFINPIHYLIIYLFTNKPPESKLKENNQWK